MAKSKSGEFYTFDEVLKQLQIDEGRLKRLVSEGEIRAFREGDQMRFKRTEIDALAGQSGGSGTSDTSLTEISLEDESQPTPPEFAHQGVLRDEIEEALNSLTPREAQILRMRFGLRDGHNYTLEEIGQKFGLTRERIRQIEAKALHRLRHPRRSRRLRDYAN